MDNVNITLNGDFLDLGKPFILSALTRGGIVDVPEEMAVKIKIKLMTLYFGLIENSSIRKKGVSCSFDSQQSTMAKVKCHHHHAVRVSSKVSCQIKKEFIDTVSVCGDLLNVGVGASISATSSSSVIEEPMGTKFKRPPFAYPTSGGRFETINQILQQSLHHQREEDISNCAAFVSYVVSMCLKAVNINCRVEKGKRKMGSDTIPHMWLVINDIVIDNCYAKALTKDNIAFLEEKHPKCYEICFYSYSSSDVASKEQEKVILVKTKKMIDLFELNCNKALALCLNREDLNNYFFAMIRSMWNLFKVNISGIDPQIRYVCWHCGQHPPLSDMFLNDIISKQLSNGVSLSDKASANASLAKDTSSADASWRFPACGHCKIASYCSKTCQKNDWKNHKFTCQGRSSICVLPSDGLSN